VTTSEDLIHEFESMSIETLQIEMQRKIIMRNAEQIIQDHKIISKYIDYIHTVEITEKKGRNKKLMMVNNFPKLIADTNQRCRKLREY
jgi:DNA primase